MTWIRRAEQQESHSCDLPSTRNRGGDLWRCDECGTLWRIADACDHCDRYGHKPHHGRHAVGVMWRRAKWWQRLVHRRDGWGIDTEADV